MLLVCPLAALPRGDARRVDATRRSRCSTPRTARSSPSTTPAPTRTPRSPTAGSRAARSSAPCTPRGSTCAPARWTRRRPSGRCGPTGSWSRTTTSTSSSPPRAEPAARHRRPTRRRRPGPTVKHRRRRRRLARRPLRGPRAARSRGSTGELMVVGEEPHRPYDRPPLSKEFLAGRVDRGRPGPGDRRRGPATPTGCSGARATGLDAATRRLTSRTARDVDADGIVIATGARARTLPGTEALAGVHTLRTLDDARALRDELRPGRRLVVIGAGFIGAEVASTAHALGLDVTVVEAAPTPLAGPLGDRDGRRRLRPARRPRRAPAVRRRRARRLGGRRPGRGGRARRRHASCAADVVRRRDRRAARRSSWLAGLRADARQRRPLRRRRRDQPARHRRGRRLRRLVRRARRARTSGSSTGPARSSGPASPSPTLLSGGGPRAPVGPPYFWSDQYGVRIQFAGHAGRRRGHGRGRRPATSAASSPSTAAPASRSPCSA